MHRFLLQSLFALLFITGAVWASSNTSESKKEDVDRNSLAQSPLQASSSSNDVSNNGNLIALLSNGGIAAVGLLSFAAVVMVILQLFGFRWCSILGSCGDLHQNGYYGDGYNSGGYSQSSYYTPSTYQKRSLEYIGPILKALSSAYDKYGKVNSATESIDKKS
ncbi:uncharacterized protein LOC142318345 isoform X2 [Lycorma delicatula]